MSDLHHPTALILALPLILIDSNAIFSLIELLSVFATTLTHLANDSIIMLRLEIETISAIKDATLEYADIP